MSLGNGESSNADVPDLDVDGEYWVNQCTGLENTHSNLCDGNCERRQLERLELEIINEERAWKRDSMNPDAIAVNGVEMNYQLQALRRLLVDKGVFTADELDDFYMNFRLENLKVLRAANRDRVKQNKVKAMLATPRKPGLLGPDGKPIG